MSNRTDFNNVATEVMEYFFSEEECVLHAELGKRIETELHDAFVAGQEHENRGLVEALREALDNWQTWIDVAAHASGQPAPPRHLRIAELRAKFLGPK